MRHTKTKAPFLAAPNEPTTRRPCADIDKMKAGISPSPAPAPSRRSTRPPCARRRARGPAAHPPRRTSRARRSSSAATSTSPQGRRHRDDTRIRVRPRRPPRQGRQGAMCSHLGRQGRARDVLARPRGHAHGRAARHGREDGARLHRRRVASIVDGMGDGEALLLENTRFYKEETKNDAPSRARGPDLLSTTRSTAHRARLHRGRHGTSRPPSRATSSRRSSSTRRRVDEPVRLLAAIVGGSRCPRRSRPRVAHQEGDKVIVGGGMTFTFLKAQQGRRHVLVEDDIQTAKDAMKLAEEGLRAHLPERDPRRRRLRRQRQHPGRPRRGSPTAGWASTTARRPRR